MKNILRSTRESKSGAIITDCAASLLSAASGAAAGVFSKLLDVHHPDLPQPFLNIENALDIHNFLGELTPWLLVCVYISVFSRSPLRAALNVFLFLAAMLCGYYIYCYYGAGFFPFSYMMVWAVLTVLSPAAAFISWYARGKGILSVLISGAILGFAANTAFSFGMMYFSFISILHTAAFIALAAALIKPPKKMVIVLLIAAIFAVLIRAVSPIAL